MTTGLSDKQLLDAYWSTGKGHPNAIGSKGLRAVADLAITHKEDELHSVRQELERIRTELTIQQRK